MDEYELINRFTYHAPTENQLPKFVAIRKAALDFAFLLDELCPDSRELSLALTALDQVVWSANAAIARRES